ncbi:MAG: hypothetical protein COA57_01185 [Flavobacteriales bacterium]|nr:MAG: hypothetical protein COA57_01185 [Flavobacteriales bacterium]
MQEEIVNKVAQSGLITLDLEEFYPEGERILYDIKDNLWEGLVLKEKDFREFVKNNDWTQYKNKFIAVTCSSDAIVPTWAYMLLTSALQPFAKRVVFGDIKMLETILFLDAINKINPQEYTDTRIVIKGCSNKPVPESAYVELISRLKPFARSIMYGEACSTVPIYKKPKG